MSPRQSEMLTKSHQWLTVTVIPALLTVILYFLMKVDKNVDRAAEAVIKHEQQLQEHDRRIDRVEQYVFRAR